MSLQMTKSQGCLLHSHQYCVVFVVFWVRISAVACVAAHRGSCDCRPSAVSTPAHSLQALGVPVCLQGRRLGWVNGGVICLSRRDVTVFPASVHYVCVTVPQRVVFQIIFERPQGTQMMPVCKDLAFLEPSQLIPRETPALLHLSGVVCQAPGCAQAGGPGCREPLTREH